MLVKGHPYLQLLTDVWSELVLGTNIARQFSLDELLSLDEGLFLTSLGSCGGVRLRLLHVFLFILWHLQLPLLPSFKSESRHLDTFWLLYLIISFIKRKI